MSDSGAILDAIRRDLKLRVTVFRTRRAGQDLWRMEARNEAGHRWITEHQDHERAAVMLGELLGIDLEE